MTQNTSVYGGVVNRSRECIDSAFASAYATNPAAQEALDGARILWGAAKRNLDEIDRTVAGISTMVADKMVATVSFTNAARAKAIQDLLTGLRAQLTGTADAARQKLDSMVKRLDMAPPKPALDAGVDRAIARVQMVLDPMPADDPLALGGRAAELLRTGITDGDTALVWVLGSSSWFRDYLRTRLGQPDPRILDVVNAMISNALDTDGSLAPVRNVHRRVLHRDGVHGIQAALGMLPDIVDELADKARREAPQDIANPPAQILYARDFLPPDPRLGGQYPTGRW